MEVNIGYGLPSWEEYIIFHGPCGHTWLSSISQGWGCPYKTSSACIYEGEAQLLKQRTNESGKWVDETNVNEAKRVAAAMVADGVMTHLLEELADTEI